MRLFMEKEQPERDNHYFCVFVWAADRFNNAPMKQKKTNDYDEAEKFYNKASNEGYVAILFEVIGGKRVLLRSTGNDDEE